MTRASDTAREGRGLRVGAEFAYNFGFGDLSDFNYWTMGAQLKYHF